MTQEEKTTFDPTEIIKVLLENKELGLAMVQIPLSLLNNWIGGRDEEIYWEDGPTAGGYYWIKDSDNNVVISFIAPDRLSYYKKSSFRGYRFAGPLIPPKK